MRGVQCLNVRRRREGVSIYRNVLCVVAKEVLKAAKDGISRSKKVKAAKSIESIKSIHDAESINCESIKDAENVSPIHRNDPISPITNAISPYAVELSILSCVDKRLVAAFTDFASESARLMGLTLARGPAPLRPTLDQWTVLSSPFVHKTARTQFERRWHGARVGVDGIWGEGVGAKYIWYLKQHCPNEVELEIKLHERHSI